MQHEHLSNNDAVFYYTSNKRIAMQASVAIFIEGPIDYSTYQEWIEARLKRIPKLKMTLNEEPFGLKHPKWIPANDFNIYSHLFEHKVKALSNQEELDDLVSKIVHTHLPLDKPLWQLHVINDNEFKKSILLLITHHAMADAQGIIELFNVFMESEEKECASSNPHSLDIKQPTSNLKTERKSQYWQGIKEFSFYLRTRAATLPFSYPASGRLKFVWQEIPLDTVQKIANAHKTTVTDVFLCALGMAIDQYAKEVTVPINNRYMLVQVPANIRKINTAGELGNKLAMLPGFIPLGIQDPIDRLMIISRKNKKLKEINMASMMDAFFQKLFSLASPVGQKLICRLMVSRVHLRLAKVLPLPPREQALLSSVIVPERSYTINGFSVSGFANIIQCQFNMGVVVSPVTYGGKTILTITTDEKNFGAPDKIMQDTVSAIGILNDAL